MSVELGLAVLHYVSKNICVDKTTLATLCEICGQIVCDNGNKEPKGARVEP